MLHTRSPLMFSAVFDALRMDGFRYLRLSASRADEIVQTMREIPIVAFNVTSPFKEDVIPLLDDLDEGARKIGAVNAIVAQGNILKGFNTDVVGVERAFRAGGIKPAGKNVIVLGAGGAARAAVAALVRNGADVVVVNRTVEKAWNIARSFGCRAEPLASLENEMAEAGILVSCLPGGTDMIPGQWFKKSLVVLDANYGEKAVIARKAADRGCLAIDGMEWLIYQGMAAFKLFTGHADLPEEIIRTGVSGSGLAAKQNIALIGFMGAGKSFVGAKVSQLMKLPFIDIDTEIEKKQNTSIKNIIDVKGEEVFRQLEAAEIEHAASLSGRVIACGGGAVLNRRMADLLAKHCIVVWLWADPGTLLNRMPDGSTRPLLRVAGGKSGIETMLHFRKPYYARISDFFIKTDNKDGDEIARRIQRESSLFFKN